MFTGKTPGELGVYGFKHRRGHAMTHPIELVSRLDYQAKPIWEWASRKGLESVVVGVPSTWPVASLRGAMLSDFTTPPSSTRRLYPDAYRGLLPEDWTWDLSDWRNQPRARFSMTLLRSVGGIGWFSEGCSLRIPTGHSVSLSISGWIAHITCSGKMQSTQAQPRAEWPLWKFYKFIDAEIGKFLPTLDDDISLLIVSDHGAQAMRGSFALNRGSFKEGLLNSEGRRCGHSGERRRLEKSVWWGEGGYVGKLHLSPFCLGKVRQHTVEELRERLQNDVWIEPSTYRAHQGFTPKSRLSAHSFRLVSQHLTIRCIGSISEEGTLWPKDNDLGADAANHHPDGLFIEQPGSGDYLLPDEPPSRRVCLDLGSWIRKDRDEIRLSLLEARYWRRN